MTLSTYPENAADIVTNTEQLLSVRLKAGDRVTFNGQYGLWVKSGTVSLYGAILGAGRDMQEIHHVFAPSTHALPAIACVSERCEIDVWNCGHSMLKLSKLSPLYRRIWNEPPKRSEPRLSTHTMHRSFSWVSLIPSIHELRASFLTWIHKASMVEKYRNQTIHIDSSLELAFGDNFLTGF